jgi:F-type H+-transporting ATPase subunit alpha
VKIKTDEIASVIKQEIEQYASELEVSEVGRVVEVGDGIARIYGLSERLGGRAGEFQTSEGSVMGQVMNLELDTVGAVVYGDYLSGERGRPRQEHGPPARGAGRRGRCWAACRPAGPPDRRRPGDRAHRQSEKVDIIAPGIADRQPVHEPLQTGIKAIDSMIPVGRGQRELIIGDRKTGKTAVAIDAIINQKQYWGTKDAVVCIYVAVGQKESTVAGVVQTLKERGDGLHDRRERGALGPGPDAVHRALLGLHDGRALHVERQGGGQDARNGAPYPKHALLVYDDLSKQAVAYRQLSLLLRRPPGREAYPGDVFYLHSRLLERATKLSDENGAGSLTALPVIETQEGDVSAYIPTNVISITDGQIYLEPDLFYKGVRPAINVGISVSRVGGAPR